MVYAIFFAKILLLLIVLPNMSYGQKAMLQDTIFTGITEALNATRRIDKKARTKPIVIYIKGGTHTLDSTVYFTEIDSGTKNAPIIYKPYPGDTVRFVGGRTLRHYQTLTNSNAKQRIDSQYHKQIIEIDLKKEGITDYGTLKATGFSRPSQPTALELFFNGEPMVRARYPNNGWMHIASVPQSGDKLVNKGLSRIKREGIPIGKHFGRFAFKEERAKKWVKSNDVWLHGYWTHHWADSYVKVAKVDTTQKEFILTPPYDKYGYTKNQKYYAFNILEELDSPGEWYLDEGNGMLYFWPPTSPENGTMQISLLESPLFIIDNTSHLTLEGFDFEVNRGGGIHLRESKNVTISNSTIRNLGTWGVKIVGGENSGIQDCAIYNIGDEGIITSGGDRQKLVSAKHFVIDNHIHHYSRINRTNRAAVKLLGVGHTVSHNYIHDAPHTAVIFDGNNHLLEYNEVHNVAQETGDVGAFYVGRDWTERGTVIRYNYFHHIYGPGAHGANAVYLDDAASGVTIYGNIFQKVDKGILLGGGHDNIIKNNIFVNCSNAIVFDARGTTWAKNYIKEGGGWKMYQKLRAVGFSQPPYSDQYPELSRLSQGNPEVPSGNRVENNLCYGNWWKLKDGAKPDYLLSRKNYVTGEAPKHLNIEVGKVYPKKKAILRRYEFKKLPLERMGLEQSK